MSIESLASGHAKTCQCGRVLPPGHPKYCHTCAPLASAFWKRAMRRQNKGSKYWLDSWLKISGNEDSGRRAYNDYMRDYMRRYRLRAQLRLRADTDKFTDRSNAVATKQHPFPLKVRQISRIDSCPSHVASFCEGVFVPPMPSETTALGQTIQRVYRKGGN